jgi:hypothetical protein
MLFGCLALFGAVTFGCSSTDQTQDGPGPCVDLNQLPTTPTISFKNDLMPIFGLSCIASSCHDTSAHKADLILGDPSACGKPTCFDGSAKWKYTFPPGNPSDALVLQVAQNLVKASTTIPSVMRVTPNQPENSFLMDKLLGLETSKPYVPQCKNQDPSKSPNQCGGTMPLDSPSLCDPVAGDPTKVQAIAMWIQQGAQNN